MVLMQCFGGVVLWRVVCSGATPNDMLLGLCAMMLLMMLLCMVASRDET